MDARKPLRPPAVVSPPSAAPGKTAAPSSSSRPPQREVRKVMRHKPDFAGFDPTKYLPNQK